jgi:hypothetical protein
MTEIEILEAQVALFERGACHFKKWIDGHIIDTAPAAHSRIAKRLARARGAGG